MGSANFYRKNSTSNENIVGSGTHNHTYSEIVTGSGNDRVNFGWLFNGYANTGSGNDYITSYTSLGRYTVNDGDGNDVVSIGGVHLHIEASRGNDNYDIWSGGNVYIDLGLGRKEITTGYVMGELVINDKTRGWVQGYHNRIIRGSSAYTKVYTARGNDKINVWGGFNCEVHSERGNNNIVAKSMFNSYVATGKGNDIIRASSGANVTVKSGGGNNNIVAESTFNSYVQTGSGHDIISASSANVTVKSGKGSDNITAGGVYAYVDAGRGNDVITINSIGAQVFAGNGNDTLSMGVFGVSADMGNGNDTVHSFAFGGQNIMLGSGNNKAFVVGGMNIIQGAHGNNYVNSVGMGNIFLLGQGQNTVLAYGAANIIFTGNGNNNIQALSGSGNFVMVGDGQNTVRAAGSSNIVWAGNGGGEGATREVEAIAQIVIPRLAGTYEYGEDNIVYRSGKYQGDDQTTRIKSYYNKKGLLAKDEMWNDRELNVKENMDREGSFASTGKFYTDTGKSANQDTVLPWWRRGALNRGTSFTGVKKSIRDRLLENTTLVSDEEIRAKRLSKGQPDYDKDTYYYRNKEAIKQDVLEVLNEKYLYADRPGNTIYAHGSLNFVVSGRGDDKIRVGGHASVLGELGDEDIWDEDLPQDHLKNLVTGGFGSFGNVVFAGEGDNVVKSYGMGSNFIMTGSGHDYIVSFGIANIIIAGDGFNKMEVIGGGNIVVGGRGQDMLSVIGYKNLFIAGDGDNIMTGSGRENIFIGAGGDDDVMIIGMENTVLAGGGDNFILAMGKDNKLQGASGNDNIFASGVENYILAGHGHNFVLAAGIRNKVWAGDGHDTIMLLGSDNIVSAGDGRNSISLGGLNNKLLSGSGRDTIFMAGYSNMVSSASGADSLRVFGKYNFIHSGGGDDSILTIGKYNTTIAGWGDDAIISVGKVNIILAEGGKDILVSIGKSNIVFAGSGNDISLTVGANNVVIGGTGSDILVTMGKNNIVLGDNSFSFSSEDIFAMAAGAGAAGLQMAGKALKKGSNKIKKGADKGGKLLGSKKLKNGVVKINNKLSNVAETIGSAINKYQTAKKKAFSLSSWKKNKDKPAMPSFGTGKKKSYSPNSRASSNLAHSDNFAQLDPIQPTGRNSIRGRGPTTSSGSQTSLSSGGSSTSLPSTSSSSQTSLTSGRSGTSLPSTSSSSQTSLTSGRSGTSLPSTSSSSQTSLTSGGSGTSLPSTSSGSQTSLTSGGSGTSLPSTSSGSQTSLTSGGSGTSLPSTSRGSQTSLTSGRSGTSLSSEGGNPSLPSIQRNTVSDPISYNPVSRVEVETLNQTGRGLPSSSPPVRPRPPEGSRPSNPNPRNRLYQPVPPPAEGRPVRNPRRNLYNLRRSSTEDYSDNFESHSNSSLPRGSSRPDVPIDLESSSSSGTSVYTPRPPEGSRPSNPNPRNLLYSDAASIDLESSSSSGTSAHTPSLPGRAGLEAPDTRRSPYNSRRFGTEDYSEDFDTYSNPSLSRSSSNSNVSNHYSEDFDTSSNPSLSRSSSNSNVASIDLESSSPRGASTHTPSLPGRAGLEASETRGYSSGTSVYTPRPPGRDGAEAPNPFLRFSRYNYIDGFDDDFDGSLSNISHTPRPPGRDGAEAPNPFLRFSRYNYIDGFDDDFDGSLSNISHNSRPPGGSQHNSPTFTVRYNILEHEGSPVPTQQPSTRPPGAPVPTQQPSTRPPRAEVPTQQPSARPPRAEVPTQQPSARPPRAEVPTQQPSARPPRAEVPTQQPSSTSPTSPVHDTSSLTSITTTVDSLSPDDISEYSLVPTQQPHPTVIIPGDPVLTQQPSTRPPRAPVPTQQPSTRPPRAPVPTQQPSTRPPRAEVPTQQPSARPPRAEVPTQQPSARPPRAPVPTQQPSPIIPRVEENLYTRRTQQPHPTVIIPGDPVPTQQPSTRPPRAPVPTQQPSTRPPRAEVPTQQPSTRPPRAEVPTQQPSTPPPRAEVPTQQPSPSHIAPGYRGSQVPLQQPSIANVYANERTPLNFRNRTGTGARTRTEPSGYSPLSRAVMTRNSPLARAVMARSARDVISTDGEIRVRYKTPTSSKPAGVYFSFPETPSRNNEQIRVNFNNPIPENTVVNISFSSHIPEGAKSIAITLPPPGGSRRGIKHSLDLGAVKDGNVRIKRVDTAVVTTTENKEYSVKNVVTVDNTLAKRSASPNETDVEAMSAGSDVVANETDVEGNALIKRSAPNETDVEAMSAGGDVVANEIDVEGNALIKLSAPNEIDVEAMSAGGDVVANETDVEAMSAGSDVVANETDVEGNALIKRSAPNETDVEVMSAGGDVVANETDVEAMSAGSDVVANETDVEGNALIKRSAPNETDVEVMSAGGDVVANETDVEGNALIKLSAPNEIDVEAMSAGGDVVANETDVEGNALIKRSAPNETDVEAMSAGGDVAANEIDVEAMSAGGDVVANEIDVEVMSAGGDVVANETDVEAMSAGSDVDEIDYYSESIVIIENKGLELINGEYPEYVYDLSKSIKDKRNIIEVIDYEYIGGTTTYIKLEESNAIKPDLQTTKGADNSIWEDIEPENINSGADVFNYLSDKKNGILNEDDSSSTDESSADGDLAYGYVHIEFVPTIKFPDIEFSKKDAEDWKTPSVTIPQINIDIPDIPELASTPNYMYGNLSTYRLPKIDIPTFSTPEVQFPGVTFPSLSLPNIQDFELNIEDIGTSLSTSFSSFSNMGLLFGSLFAGYIGSEDGASQFLDSYDSIDFSNHASNANIFSSPIVPGVSTASGDSTPVLVEGNPSQDSIFQEFHEDIDAAKSGETGGMEGVLDTYNKDTDAGNASGSAGGSTQPDKKPFLVTLPTLHLPELEIPEINLIGAFQLSGLDVDHLDETNTNYGDNAYKKAAVADSVGTEDTAAKPLNDGLTKEAIEQESNYINEWGLSRLSNAFMERNFFGIQIPKLFDTPNFSIPDISLHSILGEFFDVKHLFQEEFSLALPSFEIPPIPGIDWSEYLSSSLFGSEDGYNILGGGAALGTPENDADISFTLGKYNRVMSSEGDDINIVIGKTNSVFSGDGDDINFIMGKDTVAYALGGNDILVGAGKSNLLYGGTGDDIIFALGMRNFVTGGDGKNIIATIGLANTVVGMGGSDIYFQVGCNNSIANGFAEKYIGLQVGMLNSAFVSGDGSHLVQMGGSNTAYLNGYNATIMQVGALNTVLSGSGFAEAPESDDIITVMGSLNFTASQAGDDVVLAMGALNNVMGGDGDDVIVTSGIENMMAGNSGDDVIINLGMSSTISSGSGDDVIINSGVDTTANSGDGDDLLINLKNVVWSGANAGNDTFVEVGWTMFEAFKIPELGILNNVVGDMAEAINNISGAFGGSLFSEPSNDKHGVSNYYANNLIESIDYHKNNDQYIFGGDGDDKIIAGFSDMFAEGGSGEDDYIYTLGSGSLDIKEVRSGEEDTLWLRNNFSQDWSLGYENFYLYQYGTGEHILDIVHDERTIGSITLENWADDDIIVINSQDTNGGRMEFLDFKLSLAAISHLDVVDENGAVEDFGYDAEMQDGMAALEVSAADAINWLNYNPEGESYFKFTDNYFLSGGKETKELNQSRTREAVDDFARAKSIFESVLTPPV